MNTKYNFYLKKRTNSDMSVIYLKVNSNCKRFFLTTNIEIKKTSFCKKTNTIIKNFDNYYIINANFTQLKIKIEDYFLKLSVNQIPFNRENLQNYLLGNNINQYHCFYDAIDKYLAYNHNLSYKRTIRYFALKNTLKSTFKVLYVEDINFDMFVKFDQLFTKNCSKNTSNDKLRMILAVLHFLEKLEIKINKNIGFYKIKYTETQREFLTIPEVIKIMDYTFDTTIAIPTFYRNVLKYYLFSCFTGLRYSDIKQISKNPYNYIRENILYIRQKKTNAVVTIPLNKQALFLLENNALETIYCDARTNKYLKEIMKIVGIDRKITFHTSRHTFAVSSITIGIPIEVLQRLLGHRELKNTLRYAKIVEPLKIQEMQKWNLIG